jgi:hypothetical protein
MRKCAFIGIISLCMTISISQAQVTTQSVLEALPVMDGMGFMHIHTVVSNGVTVNHDVWDLFLTDTSPPRASYILSIITRTSSRHSIEVLSRDVVVPCYADNRLQTVPNATTQQFCTLNRYQSSGIYVIALFDL